MPRTKASSSLELLVPLRRDDPEPLHRQLERRLRESIRSGRLAANSVLPSTRALSSQLGVSRGIVVEAYEQLVAEGYLAARPGGTTRVARTAALSPAPVPDPVAAPYEFDFRAGRPDLAEFPRAVWLRSLRRAVDRASIERFGYPDLRGVPELRATLSVYLNRARGTATDPASIVVTAGFVQAIRLVAEALRRAGARRIAFEHPSQPEPRAIVRIAGLDSVAIPVDERGLLVERLDDVDVDAVLVTPAHQYPTGAVLPPERRARLVEWARRRDAIIVEDDYDAEFRYDREPVGPVQGLCPDRVVYAGSASKMLAPGLRLGWLALPASLVDGVVAAKRVADFGSPVFDQLAFADFVSRGELDHHLRRLRPIYRRRRDLLLAVLERHLPELRPVGASAGLHVLAWLPDGADAPAIAAAAGAAGIGVTPVAPDRGDPPVPPALILGYGSMPDSAIETGVCRLAEVLAAERLLPDRPVPR